MKAWTIVCAMATLALATVNAGNTQGQTSADSCDLIKIFGIVKPLETNEDVKKCIAATGYELLPPPGAPSKEQIAKLCDNASCKTVFATLQKMDIPDCSISILGGLNMKKVINDAFGQCGGSTGATTKPATTTTTAPAAAASATPVVTPAPASGKGGAAPAPATPAASQAPTGVPSGNAKLPDNAGVGLTPAPVPGPVPAPAAAPASGKGSKKLCHD